jgi:parallel beta-helix repeat protein
MSRIHAQSARTIRQRPPLRRPRRQSPVALTVEWLENRQLLATFYVSNNNDAGAGSLRTAIEAVNLDPTTDGADTIETEGTDVGTIDLLSPLPALARGQVTIEDLEIDGSSAGTGDGLDVDADQVSLLSLSINAFAGAGVSVSGNELTATNNTIGGNSGTGLVLAGNQGDVGGNVLTDNSGDGIEVDGSDNQIGTGGAATGPYQGTGGNVVSSNGQHGIYLNGPDASGNTVENNAVGTNATGTSGQGNGFWGVFLDDAPDTVIADNLISANAQGGLGIRGALSRGESVHGNFIGTDVTGTSADLGNGYSGVYVGDWGVAGDAPSNSTIGGTADGAGNLISANGSYGVWITGAGVTGVLVEGNTIGTVANGTYARGNQGDGVEIDSGAVNNTIGGTTAGAGNLISGNAGGIAIIGPGTNNAVIAGNKIGTNAAGTGRVGNDGWGIFVQDSAGDVVSQNLISGNDQGGLAFRGIDSQDELVQGNDIGTDITGTLSLGNEYSGIYVGNWGVSGDAASDVTIGGTAAADGNVISANLNWGVWLTGAGTTGVLVEGNWIGSGATGAPALGNSDDGVRIDSGASGNTIGGTAAGAGNVIAYNGGNGVLIGASTTDTTTGNSVLQNAIFANAKLGIDLGADGVTQNDSAGHSGPNLFQDYPALSSVATANGMTTITGTLFASPDTTYRLEFFSSVVADAAGNGPGQTFLTFVAVTTDGTGAASFSIPTPTPVAAGLFISATATDPDGNTSEFSADAVNSPGTFTSVAWTGAGGDNLWSDPVNWSDDQIPGAGEDVSINLAGSFTIQYSNAAGTSTIHSLTGSDSLSISGGSLAVSGSSSLGGDLSIDGGSLTLGSSSTLSGPLSLGGGTLNIHGSENTITGHNRPANAFRI